MSEAPVVVAKRSPRLVAQPAPITARNTRLILLTGSIGSGKSACATILKKIGYGEEYFSKPIKEFAKLIGFTDSQVYGSQRDKMETNAVWGISGRRFLQLFGTEIGRNALPQLMNYDTANGNIWSRVMENKIQRYMNLTHPLVISDGRFDDEALLVKRYGGIIVKLVRPEAPDGAKPGSAEAQHSSEQPMTVEPDFVIVNDGSLDDLAAKIKRIL